MKRYKSLFKEGTGGYDKFMELFVRGLTKYYSNFAITNITVKPVSKNIYNKSNDVKYSEKSFIISGYTSKGKKIRLLFFTFNIPIGGEIFRVTTAKTFISFDVAVNELSRFNNLFMRWIQEFKQYLRVK